MRTIRKRRWPAAAALGAFLLCPGLAAAGGPLGTHVQYWGFSAGPGAEHRGFFQQSLFVRAGVVLPRRIDHWFCDRDLSLRWIPEAFGGTIRDGVTSFEVGLNALLFQIGPSWERRWAPFAQGGFGLVYNDLRGAGLGQPVLFTNQAGVGIRYSLNESMALTGAYRFRHISNAGLSEKNRGLDTHFALIGVDVFLRPPP